MRKQTLIALLAAVTLSGVSVAAMAEDGRDRDRNGGWKIEKQHDRDRPADRDRNREDRRKAKRKAERIAERKEARQERRKEDRRKARKAQRDRDRIVINNNHDHDRDRYRQKRKHRDRDTIILLEKGRRHHRPYRDRDVYVYDRPAHGPWSYLNHDFARVVRVVPINKVIRQGRHCRNDYGVGDWLELNLGDIIISAGNDRDDCRYIDREVRKHYRVTYKYRGRLHTVRMWRHPGEYVRVNRHGELIRGRY